jgi:flagellar biogenesis protein FliO
MTTGTLLVSSAGAFRVRVLGLWERVLRLSRRAPRRLRLCESLPLGERRFVAVVEFERARFLVGGTPSSLVLLSRLADAGRVEDDVEDEPEDRLWSAASTGETKQRGETC